MRCAFILLLIERSATLMPTPPASMPRRSPGVKRAASEPTAEREPTAPEPDTRPTSYANKYNWTAKAQAPLGEATARNRLAALKAAAEDDETIIRVKWSDPRTIAGLCVFIPLLGAGVLYLVFMTCAEGSSAPSTRRRRESGSRLGRRRLFFDEFLAISRGFICASKNIELADLCSAVGVG